MRGACGVRRGGIISSGATIAASEGPEVMIRMLCLILGLFGGESEGRSRPDLTTVDFANAAQHSFTAVPCGAVRVGTRPRTDGGGSDRRAGVCVLLLNGLILASPRHRGHRR